MLQSFAKDGLRPPVPGQTSSLVLPRELTPLVAEGATMEPLFINSEWINFKIHGACDAIVLPSKDEARASLWMDQAVMDGAREYLCYECHDLRVVRTNQDGQLELLVCKRVEPSSAIDGLETAPLNGFWWSIGGRREIPKSGSVLDGKFSLVDSVLQKTQREAGIPPKNVLGIYDLGVGRVEFPARMSYVSFAASEEKAVRKSVREVTLSHPQHTIARNFIVMVNSETTVADQSVEKLTWLSESEYADPQTRAKFCDYEKSFMDAIFEGWRFAKLQDRTLDFG